MVFSPLIFAVSALFFDSSFVFNVGEIHREVRNYYSRSPLSETGLFLVSFVLFNSCRGDSQGSIEYILSFSPLFY